eukprot:2645645-Rhodomonas_salina.2
MLRAFRLHGGAGRCALVFAPGSGTCRTCSRHPPGSGSGIRYVRIGNHMAKRQDATAAFFLLAAASSRACRASTLPHTL